MDLFVCIVSKYFALEILPLASVDYWLLWNIFDEYNFHVQSCDDDDLNCCGYWGDVLWYCCVDFFAVVFFLNTPHQNCHFVHDPSIV